MVHQVDDKTFEDHISKGGVVAVKYYADWCGSCKLFAPKFRRISEEAEMADVVFVDVNAEENEKARKMAGVDNLPFLAVFKDGKLIEGSATSKEDYFRKMIEMARS